MCADAQMMKQNTRRAHVFGPTTPPGFGTILSAMKNSTRKWVRESQEKSVRGFRDRFRKNSQPNSTKSHFLETIIKNSSFLMVSEDPHATILFPLTNSFRKPVPYQFSMDFVKKSDRFSVGKIGRKSQKKSLGAPQY